MRRVERVAGRFDCVAERLEQRAEEGLAAAAGNSRETRLERQVGRRQLRFPLASTGQRRVEPAREHDREQRRRDVRPVVDVLILGPPLPPRPRTMPTGSTSSSTAAVQARRWPPGRRPWRCRRKLPACARARGACAAGIRDRWPADGSFGSSGACRRSVRAVSVQYLAKTSAPVPRCVPNVFAGG